MFRKALHDEIRNIFGLKAVDWAGALHDGADIVYVESGFCRNNGKA